MAEKRKVEDSSSDDDNSAKLLCDVPQNNEQILLQPFNYIMREPGKNIRKKLAQAFNYWMKIPDEKLKSISEIITMLHNASLLVDDIEDNSVLRRGLPVAHSIYGVGSTINSANYVYFLGLERVLALGHPQAVAVFSEQMLELHRGQGLDIHWRDTFCCPSEDQYRAMVVQKTGGLFGLATRLMQLFSADASADYTALTDTLGLYFQIRDDYANLCLSEYTAKKTFCEDLSEGKFSFPIIHAVQSRRCAELLYILRNRPKENELKKYCVSLLEKCGSLAYTRTALAQLDAAARAQTEALGCNPLMTALLDALCDWRA